MKTKTYNVYKYDELTKEQQEKVLDNLRDINVGHDWWDGIYYDASEIGLELESFDLDRNRHATGKLTQGGYEVAEAILKEYGPMCDTYMLATEYVASYKKLPTVGGEVDDAEVEELDEVFTDDLIELYSLSLQTDYEYLMTDEAVLETIEANDYDFTTNGKID